MNAVTFLLAYAVALSWLAPGLLTGYLPTGISPRLAVSAWLTAVATALIAWAGALVILVVGATRSLLTHTELTFCVETLGIADAVTLPPTAATVVVLGLLMLTGAATIQTGRRVVGTLRRVRRSNCEHAEAVRIVGRATGDKDVVVITADQPTAYCVSGGARSTIVVTSAALELLNPPQVAAVLAHERAHLRGRHHHIVALLGALSAALPRLPLLRSAAHAVPPLLEMCADDAATRSYGRAPLLTSLVALSTRHRLPDGALAAAGTAVVQRALRLTQPAGENRWHFQALATSVVLVATLATPGLAFTLCLL